ncbi:MAG: hypothetical protein IT356_04265 [Gemmatimonadaceae bacterium]|nr:hypothetical protein [Gemmatimonadaceae bacterium]
MTAPRQPLTPVEQRLYEFLLDFLAEHTFQPSVREIGRALRIPSTKSVTDILDALALKGYVRRHPGRSRGVSLVGFAGAMGTVPLPLLALDPLTGSFVAEDYVTVDRRVAGASDACLVRALPFGLPAHGINANDLVIVHPSARANDGDVVVARVARAILVSAMIRRGAGLVLTGAAGPGDLHLSREDDFEILGVAVGVIRPPRRGATA